MLIFVKAVLKEDKFVKYAKILYLYMRLIFKMEHIVKNAWIYIIENVLNWGTAHIV